MPVRRYRFILLAGIASLALLAAGAREALAQREPHRINLTNARALDFGRFVAGSGGTVVVTPGGLRTRSGAVVLLNSPGVGQAALNASRVNGNKGIADIALPLNGSIWLTSGANRMAVSHFVSSPALTMSIAPAATLSIGATLTVAPDQPPGSYSGTFPVTVIYQ